MVGDGTALVVEDDPAVRDMTTELLKRAGYEVSAVADGARPIAAGGADEPIDVAGHGRGHAQHVRHRARRADDGPHPQIGVVLLSGYTAETLNLERVTARGAQFVPKPARSGQLLTAVREAATSHRTSD